MTATRGLIGLVAGCLLLTGCASPLAGKPADSVAITAIERNLRESRYNFDGSIRIEQLQLAPSDGKAAESPINRRARDIIKSLRIDLTGAVDAKARKLELNPTLRFARRNAEVWLRVPMLIDADHYALLVDASAFDLVFDSLGGANEGKLLRLQLPESMAKQIPLTAILDALPGIVRDGYRQVDPQAFKLLPLDDEARQLGAQYLVELKLDNSAQLVLSTFIFDGVKKVVQQQHPQPVAATPERVDPTLMADTLGVLLKASSKDVQNDQTTQLLLDRSGRLLGMRQHTAIGYKGFSASMLTTLRLFNYNHPTFTLDPVKSGVIELKDLPLPSWLDDRSPKSPKSDQDDTVASAEPVTLSPPVPVLQPRKAKTVTRQH
ncbi:hypothetical protein OL229_21690 [Neisseriaceae bacterium JH1-16]|nr:hypothetical protein [Neisseriaceae bacterium JH1-16]